MKLYYWLRDWQLPGQQHKSADRVEVPTTPAGLCAWLNERRVPIAMPLTEPPPPDVQLASQRPREMAPGFCGECGQSAAGKLKLSQGGDVEAVIAWVDTAELWQLQSVAEEIKAHVAALNEQLVERTVQ